MSKRFTDTSKWIDPWFAELNQSDKLLWFYLTDNCNQAGVIDFSKRMADFMIGCGTDIESFINNSSNRVKRLKNGKLLLTKFLSFQNGKISENCKAHKPIIKLLEENEELVEELKETLSDTLLNSLLDRLQVKVIVKVKEMVMVKEQVKVTEEEQKETCYSFEDFWIDYEKKGNRKTSKQRFEKLSEEVRLKIKYHVTMYVSSTPDKQYKAIQKRCTSLFESRSLGR